VLKEDAMSLKFKRNYPLILLLVAILTFLTLAMGDQRIVAYTAKAQGQQTELVGGTRLDVTDEVAPLDGDVAHDSTQAITKTLTSIGQCVVHLDSTELLGQNISQY
jgi:hypothetical protein